MSWGELRCAKCIAAGRYSKILLKFSVPAIQSGGEIAVQCRCGSIERLTTDNQFCNGVNTFRSEMTAVRVARTG